MIQCPRGKQKRGRIRVRGAACSKLAIVVRREMGKQAPATGTPLEIANNQEVAIAAREEEIPLIAMGEAERATRVQIVEVGTR